MFISKYSVERKTTEKSFHVRIYFHMYLGHSGLNDLKYIGFSMIYSVLVSIINYDIIYWHLISVFLHK